MALAAVGYGAWGFFIYRDRVRNLCPGRDEGTCRWTVLEGLRTSRARIFHDIRGDNFNLDHVVIVPAGTFVVETKTISKLGPQARVSMADQKVLVTGRPLHRDPLAQVRAQIDLAFRVGLLSRHDKMLRLTSGFLNQRHCRPL
jgi:nuclease-like protein